MFSFSPLVLSIFMKICYSFFGWFRCYSTKRASIGSMHEKNRLNHTNKRDSFAVGQVHSVVKGQFVICCSRINGNTQSFKHFRKIWVQRKKKSFFSVCVCVLCAHVVLYPILPKCLALCAAAQQKPPQLQKKSNNKTTDSINNNKNSSNGNTKPRQCRRQKQQQEQY